MEAEVIRSRAQEARQRELLKNGSTTQVKYDQALKTLRRGSATQCNTCRTGSGQRKFGLH